MQKMRYQPSKLVQLYHQKKLYHSHLNQLDKIKNKAPQSPRPERPPLNISLSRSQHLKDMRDRLHISFQHTQAVRDSQIRKQNNLLYRKVNSSRTRKSQSYTFRDSNTSNRSLTAKEAPQKLYIERRSVESSLQQRLSLPDPKTLKNNLLRNHRCQPISKTTVVDRAQENLRLALKLHQPCPTINTKKLEKIHEETVRLKQRIMRYNSNTPKQNISYEDQLITQIRNLHHDHPLKAVKEALQMWLQRKPINQQILLFR